MQIAEELLQTYFLGVHPRDQASVAQTLEEARPSESDEVGAWHLFARLSRPGIVALRNTRRTTGLDLFLLDPEKFAGVEDVAEFLAFGFDEQPTLATVLGGDGCLFMTFIRLNWDGLTSANLWESYEIEVPQRSAILSAVPRLLRAASRQGALQGRDVAFSVHGGVGDCDLLVVGRARHRRDLDLFLLTLTQVGTDNVAAELGGRMPPEHTPLPICAASTTELAIPWGLYAEGLVAAKAGVNLPEAVIRQTNACLDGGLRAAVLLRRARSALASIRDDVRQCIPDGWEDNAVLGEADMLVKWADKPTTHSLAQLVQLLAALDTSAAKNDDFPRRFSVVLSFDPDGKRIERSEVFGKPMGGLPTGAAQAPLAVSVEGLSDCLSYLRGIKDQRMREELRTVERMVERCLTLQRHADLPMETRRLARLGLQRIGRVVARLRELMETGGEQSAEEATLRFGLVNSGHHLDRTLSHLVRGSIPLLFSSAAQARATDHFASETLLASALGAPASAVAQRLKLAVIEAAPLKGKPPSEYHRLLSTLDDMSQPIIYASHELDFRLIRPLCIIHVPRWVIWYPTASSFVLHELGHAVLGEGQLSKLLEELCRRAASFGRVPAITQCLGVIERGLQALKTLEAGTSASWHDWKSDREEDAAELFNRLFAYPLDSSATYLQDWLEYQYSEAPRRTEPERRSFLARTLTVHLAMDLVSSDPSIWKLSDGELWSVLRNSLLHFRAVLDGCESGRLPPFHKPPYENCDALRADVAALSQEIQVTLARNSSDPPSYPNDAIEGCIEHAILLALTVRSIDGFLSEETEGCLCQTTWQATLSTASSFLAAGAKSRSREQLILQDLQAGRVPKFLSQWPEQLPRKLHAACRNAGESVRIQQRIALSLCLADWVGCGGSESRTVEKKPERRQEGKS